MYLNDTAAVGMTRIRAALLGVLLPAFAPGLSQTAMAQEIPNGSPPETREEVFSFDIPVGPLGPALSRFAVVTGHQLLAESRLVSGVEASAVTGSHAAEDALRLLLAGTGLTFETVDAHTYVLARQAALSGPVHRASGTPDAIRLSRSPASPGRQTDTTGSAGRLDPQEVILVTGSRFRRPGRNAVLPVQVIGRASLEASGAVEIGEMIASQSPATLEFSSASTHLSAQNAGLTSIGLRGLGTTRTLVLIDGRRTVSNSGNASRFGSDTIPAEFVERVEISTGGASADYGSDAIAGVMNFVLVDALEGGRLLAQAGVTQDGGGRYEAFSATQGWRFSGGRGRLLVNLTRDRTHRIGAGDRDWARAAVALTADGERLETDLSSYPPGGRFMGYDFWFDETGLQTGFDTEVDGYDTRALATVSVPRDRDLLALKADYHLADRLSVHFTGLFSHSDSLSSREPQTAYYRERFGPGNERIGGIPLDHPFLPRTIRDAAIAEGHSTISWRRRFSELGPEYRQIDRTTRRIWAGVSGETANWTWDFTAGHGRYDQSQLRSGEINYAHLQAALDIEPDPATAGQYRCRDAAARADGCMPADLFGVGSLSTGAADYIRATDRLAVEVEQWTLGASAVGDLPLPGGKHLPLAWGLEYRIDRQRTEGDDASLRRETGYVGVPDLDAASHAGEAFAETRLPLIEDRPGIQRLDLSAALRLAHYDTGNVGLVSSYRLGLSWTVSNQLGLRGQVSRAQRAPSLIELHSGPRGDYDTVSDPCHGTTATMTGDLAENCRAEAGIAETIADTGIYEQRITNIYAPNSGNPDLQEERSDAVTLGAVLAPSALEGFSVSVDLYDIRVSGAISTLSSQALLEECYGAPLAIGENAYCDDIVRAENGQLSRMSNRLANLNEIRSAGFDITLDHRWQAGPGTPLAGEWDLRLLYAHTGILEQEFERSDGAVRHTVWDGEVDAPEHRWTARLGWSRARWRLQWRMRYIGAGVDSHSRAEAANAADMLFLEIDPWMQHDVYAHYAFGEDRRVRVFAGINNVFHDYGPFLPRGTESGGRRNFSPGYDVEGRRYYAGIRARW
ncbi:TonB-dependent receptor [Maricaulis sp.]|uniref:TonB-dependent receptor n=1 Tax=Maricaulis sp. TaxID=1486257 RepID=UPI0026106190|nr:TonB-dependent receptor [Maricaulis sp.]